ncbi:hypothetical protein ScPMuIL_015449 [Solemya velum]
MFENYLSNRKQRTVSNDSKFIYKNAKAEVPQGSVLGLSADADHSSANDDEDEEDFTLSSNGTLITSQSGGGDDDDDDDDVDLDDNASDSSDEDDGNGDGTRRKRDVALECEDPSTGKESNRLNMADLGRFLEKHNQARQEDAKTRGVCNMWELLVNGETRHIGCAYAQCRTACLPNNKILQGKKKLKIWYYVCNYDIIRKTDDPSGESCSCCTGDPDQYFKCTGGLCYMFTEQADVAPGDKWFYDLFKSCSNAIGDSMCKQYSCEDKIISELACKKECGKC